MYSGGSKKKEINKFIRDLEKAINGEYSAIECYERMADQASNEKERNQILEIRKDEIKHFEQFLMLYTSITGRSHSPVVTEECPGNYRLALLAAFEDEQNTVDLYNSMADRAPDSSTRRMFRRAALDEQHHAVWFLSYLTVR
ncbi:ferritin-like domain-containing protein [Evansella clarkii]|uniref:ferritin-like domain-containing protein n=1 Tax=Evansella clarkii TaxID=79879 RepID=UPI000B44AFCD|nr:ferritin-like domain-containing protein [Evansella clarkii]